MIPESLDLQLKVVQRDYNGRTNADFTGVLSSNIPVGFDLVRTGSWTTAQANFEDKHVGTDKPIIYRGDGELFKVQTVHGVPVYGAKQNYVGDIAARELSVGGLVAADKVYDASRNASVSGLLLNSIEGDDVRLTELHGLFNTKDVGQDKQVSVTVGTLAGDDARNYVFRPPSNLSTTADITPRPVTADGLVAADKVYDGTRNAEVSGRLSGVLPGDDFRAGQLNGQFDTKNVGNNKTVTITASGAAGRDAANYVLEGPLTTTASITPREAQIGLTGQVRKVYDGNTVATLAPGQFVLSGIVASDAVVIDGPVQGRYDNANAGQNKTVTVTGPFVISGADAINYTYGGVVLDGGAHTVSTTVSGAIGEITRRTLALTGVTAASKVYDARTSATILGGALGNVVAGDDVGIGDLTGTFEDKHAGTGKLVTVSIGGLSGTAAGNYELPAGTATTRADITPRPISVQGLSASDKVYDGRDTASISGTPSSALPGDQLQIGSLEGRFSDKNVGTNKAVIVTGGALSGADAGNYRLDGLGNTTASITPRAAQIGITGQVQKEYDGTQAATLGAGQYALSGILDADAVTVAGPTAGRYDSADAGQGKTVTVSGPFVISGADAINYSFGGVTLGGTGANTITTTATGIGAIMRRMLSLSSLVAANKVYDGTVGADVRASLGNVVGDDEVRLGTLSGAFDSRHAGTGKRVNVSAGALSGADAANYMLPETAFSTTADITPLTLSAAGIRASDKVYDGNTSASLTGAPTGVLAGDQVTIGTLAGQFDNKNVGTGKTVAISGGALSGADAGNYRLDGRLATTASITPRPVTLALTGQTAKEYDATSSAVLGANQYAMANLVAGDDIGVRGPTQGSYDTPNVGQQKAVSVSGPFDFSGVDAANYSLNGVRLGSGVNASVTANIGRITPAVLTYQANPAVVESTLPFGTLNGTVSGFRGGDTLASATTGQLAWQAGAANGAAPGSYPILGAGLAAANYEFVQAPGNATALVVRPGETIRSVTSSATNAVSAALAATNQVPSLPPASSPVADSTGAGSKAFSPVRIGSMSQEELAQMLAQRRNFKQNLFSAAIYKLEMDPSLADLRPCTTVAEASSGACRISTAQLELLHASRPQVQVQVQVQEQIMRQASGKSSNLPKIERKIAVLFGVNEYNDKAIPRLENAITDVDAIAKLFEEKLGYEVRVLHNPGKAEMIRALNALATEVGSADSVVVYYAGHGYSLEKNGAGYWLPSDAAASDPRQWISNSDVAKILSGIRSRQMALISDSCYSGAFAREGMANVGRNVNADDVLSKRSVVVLSSGGDEPVPDEGRGNHSIFAWNLMQVVGSVANWKPGSTVFEGVQEAVRKEFPQTPQYGTLTAAGHQAGGDYLFEFRSR
ncbi:YDG domain-containing protein [Massilia oculi]|uniref:YDG domain-containing protein n=1 Tax=Massilia hydrophila TaxID=3044279 RepID=A0ABS7Y7G9_9BURK|nr:YDG domain-containing protein [Massilia oculi]